MITTTTTTTIHLLLLLLTQLTSSLDPSQYLQGGTDWEGTCKNENNQSPINILEYQTKCSESHTFEFKIAPGPIPINIIQNNTDLYFESDFFSFFFTNLEEEFHGYTSEIIKIRSPSEHFIDGTHYDLEMQIYGKLKPEYVDGKHQTAVLSLMMKELSSDDQQFAFE